MSGPIRLGVVAGEESGDLLAADLVDALRRLTGRDVELTGVGGEHLAARGLKSLFDPGEIALMGFTAVITRLPGLIRRIRQTTDHLVAAKPDLLLIVDSPDFTHRVARRVRAACPDVPVVDYVCPSVWAWRPGRAPAMRAYVDHVLCLLPFEPETLERLGGPAATYVGHKLVRDEGLEQAWQARLERPFDPRSPVLCLLPGSRRSEVKSLLPFFGETVDELAKLGPAPDLLLPTVPHVEAMVRDMTRDWDIRPEIATGEQARRAMFARADAALAASGTVTLELALAGIPLVSCYQTDMIARLLRRLITAWSASLPNLIAGYPVVPELYEFMLRPNYTARHLSALLSETPSRSAQVAGFEAIRDLMATERPSGEIAAGVVVSLLDR